MSQPTHPTRTCAELGVCQHRATPCAGCARPATPLQQANTDGSCAHSATQRHHLDDITPTPLPWDWMDDIRDFAVLAPLAATLCGIAAMTLGAIVGYVLKG